MMFLLGCTNRHMPNAYTVAVVRIRAEQNGGFNPFNSFKGLPGSSGQTSHERCRRV
jgi:hypothetical protein